MSMHSCKNCGSVYLFLRWLLITVLVTRSFCVYLLLLITTVTIVYDGRCTNKRCHSVNFQNMKKSEIHEQVKQGDVFKRQTLVFHFPAHRRNSFKHLSDDQHTPVRLYGITVCYCRSSKQQVIPVIAHQRHFLNHEQTSYTKHPWLIP